MQQNDNPFSDKRGLLAIVLFVGFLYGWNAFLAKKYPNYGKPQPQVAEEKKEANSNETPQAQEINNKKLSTNNAEIKKPSSDEKQIHYEGKNISFDITSKGLGLKNLVVKNYQGHDQKQIQLGVSDQTSLFETRLSSQQEAIQYSLEENTPGFYTGTARLGETEIKRTIKVNAETASIESNITITKPNAEIARGISVLIPEQISSSQSKSFLFPSYEHQDFFVSHSGNTESINFSAAKENIKKEFKTVGIVSIGSQYFATALLDKSSIAPDVELQASPSARSATAEIVYRPAQAQNEYIFSQILYAGPKSIDTLQAIDNEMASLINFGALAVIAKPLLFIMKWFHGLVGNWGFAIILLTLLVRFAVLPINLMSMRSMKAMQRIQPKINALRERYKDDPMTLNKEMMQLMKENKANPLGGCLPMLLQIPIFFALYRVIGSSIELYQSPFIGWITDLSAHDHFYVLPVLMGITMFVQQKMTPSTMDPAQAKVMAFLPLIFTAFMLQLPSGLTLYMFVSATFGIIQQWLVMKDNNKSTSTQIRKA